MHRPMDGVLRVVGSTTGGTAASGHGRRTVVDTLRVRTADSRRGTLVADMPACSG